MPECFVVPKTLTDADVAEAVPQFIDYRCPVWISILDKVALLMTFEQFRNSITKLKLYFRCFFVDVVLQLPEWSRTF